MILPTRSIDRLGALVALGVCLSLGFNQVAVKIALGDIPPLLQAALRSAGGTFVLALVACITERGFFRRDGTLWAGLGIGIFFGIEFIALYLGLQQTSASHAVLFLYTAPFFLALGLIVFVPEERLRPLQWTGLALAFLGVTFALGSSSTAPNSTLLGDLLCLAAGALWAATTLMIKATGLRFASPLKTLFYQLAVSSPVITVAAFLHGEVWPQKVSSLALASMAYQTLWIVCLTFLIWFWLLRRYRAGELSAFSFLTPVIGVFAGWLILEETIDIGLLVALVLVAAGILMVNWPQSAFPSARAIVGKKPG
jgi:drug/metabolite transporter (DMT)-like permease